MADTHTNYIGALKAMYDGKTAYREDHGMRCKMIKQIGGEATLVWATNNEPYNFTLQDIEETWYIVEEEPVIPKQVRKSLTEKDKAVLRCLLEPWAIYYNAKSLVPEAAYDITYGAEKDALKKIYSKIEEIMNNE